MKQRRITSLIESMSNTAVGYLIAVITQIVALPYWGVTLPMTANLQIAFLFMSIGMARGYIWRRLFEWLRVTGRFA